MKRCSIALLAVAIPMISACAQKPEAIQAAYVSPTSYQGWSCQQLQSEAVRVDNALMRASEQQEKARSNDTVGVIFLGLPVSSLSGGNVATQIADLKGRKEVLEQTQISRNCIVMKSAAAS
ncbi:hypothetical protein [Paracoccus sediminilitoris]|uniref:hypothetical protein n=1 Tax=Paracoccus sediminilitoris TaxID=2202419 RepID=UPI002729B948|nr:hypothetical protein [Paracoccus sediminilitoris]